MDQRNEPTALSERTARNRGSFPLGFDRASDAARQTAAPVKAWQRWLGRRLLRSAGNPPISIILWNGEELHRGGDRPVARIHVRDPLAVRRTCSNPSLGFGDCYSDGQIDVEGDLVELLLAVEHSTGHASTPGPLASLFGRGMRRRGNSLAAARDNIYHHYDIGNKFYGLWLDDSLAYTCAYFPSPDVTLEEAQAAKFDHICRKLELRPGERVVEAGCGWGGLALHMARNYGVQVRAYNISREQVAYARRRATAEGLADRVEFVEDDWRNIAGEHDVFVSVGMLEHVGKENYARLGAVIRRACPRGRRGLIHSIGRNRPQPLDPWIERRIFPGAYGPTLAEMTAIFEPNDLSVLDVENLRLHYALTIRHWLQRFEKSADRVAAMFDERFVRMWRLYLSGSIAAFESGGLQLFQIVFAPAHRNDVPWTRTHLYTDARHAARERSEPKPHES